MCRSSCENFFRVCGYEKDLWRCGPSKFFNGYFPEVRNRSFCSFCVLCPLPLAVVCGPEQHVRDSWLACVSMCCLQTTSAFVNQSTNPPTNQRTQTGAVTRDYFPGQPFRDYDPGRKTCTPSLEGAASRGARPAAAVTLAAVGLAVGAVLLGGWWGG